MVDNRLAYQFYKCFNIITELQMLSDFKKSGGNIQRHKIEVFKYIYSFMSIWAKTNTTVGNIS